jgi:hypothetical protein
MPKINRQEISEEQRVAKQISAMGDSVWVINKLITEGTHSEQIHNTINRNVQHLELMIGKDAILNSGTDLSSFSKAITDGIEFVPVVE